MTVDPFAEHDAAYVLGALSPEDRRTYEEHLSGCPDCARAVGELAGMPGLLAKVDLADLLEEPASPPPPTLLPALARAVHRRQLRRRWTAALGAVAAAGLAVGLAGGLAHSTTPPAAPPTGTALSQVSATSLHASARLVDVAWGTRIDLTCSYDTRYGPDPAASYVLVVVDRAGHAAQVASWAAVPGRISLVSGASAVHAADIARLEVRTSTGTPVLQLTT